MENPLLSIIVANYNSSDSLIDSITEVSHIFGSTIEFIIIDDCSDELVVNRLKRYADSNEMISLFFNSLNQGPGYSRNRGINEANGKYITFLDSDDSFDIDSFSIIVEQLEFDYDVIVFDYYSVSKETAKHCSSFFCHIEEGLIDKGLALAFIKGSPWGKIYKKSIIESNSISFPPKYHTEDLPFTKIAISKCESVFYLPIPGYNYYINPLSLSQNNRLDVNNEKDSLEIIENCIGSDYKDEYQIILLIHYIYYVGINAVNELSREEWDSCLPYSSGFKKEIHKNKYYKILLPKHRIVSELVLNHNYSIIKALSLLFSLL